jgi:hypothetical protein
MIPSCFGIEQKDTGICYVCPMSCMCQEIIERGLPIDGGLGALQIILREHPDLDEIAQCVFTKTCPLCGIKFSTWGEFSIHKMDYHDETPPIIYKVRNGSV